MSALARAAVALSSVRSASSSAASPRGGSHELPRSAKEHRPAAGAAASRGDPRADRARHGGCRARPPVGRATRSRPPRRLGSCLGERQEVRRVAPLKLLRLARLRRAARPRTRGSSPASRSALRVAQQALVDERLQRVEVGAADLLRGLQRAAAAEDRKPGEELLLPFVEQLVAPLDRAAERALALGQVSRAAGEEPQPLLEPLEDLRRRERLHARGGQLERERQVVEPPADLGDGLVGLEARARPRGRARGRSRRPPRARAAAPGTPARPSRAAARGSSRAGRGWGRRRAAPATSAAASTTCSKLSNSRSMRLSAMWSARPFVEPTDLRRRLQHELGLAERRQRHPPDAVADSRQTPGRAACEREPRLTGATRARSASAGECPFEQADDLDELALPAEEGRRRNRQVRPEERLERRELAVSELVDALGRGEILEPVLAEVGELDLDELRAWTPRRAPGRRGRRRRCAPRGGRRRRRSPPRRGAACPCAGRCARGSAPTRAPRSSPLRPRARPAPWETRRRTRRPAYRPRRRRRRAHASRMTRRCSASASA